MTMAIFWTLLALCMIFKQASAECISRDEFHDALNVLQEEIARLKEKPSSTHVLLDSARSKNPKRFLEEPMGGYAAFSVLLNTTGLENLGSGQTIMFDTVISNLGNAFDLRLSVFTAKTTGWYVFSLTIMTRPSETNMLHVVNNGDEIFHVYSTGDEYNTASKTVVTHLTAGDEVWVKSTSNPYSGSIHGYGHTSFSGWLQYSD